MHCYNSEFIVTDIVGYSNVFEEITKKLKEGAKDWLHLLDLLISGPNGVPPAQRDLAMCIFAVSIMLRVDPQSFIGFQDVFGLALIASGCGKTLITFLNNTGVCSSYRKLHLMLESRQLDLPTVSLDLYR